MDDTRDQPTKKEHHHGGAVCRVQRRGYGELDKTLVVASLEGVGQGCCHRIQLYYVNW